MNTRTISRTLAALGMLAMLLVASAPAVQAQTAEDALLFSERLPATGPRSLGMAGVGIAGVGDFSALYTNPAGLGHARSSMMSAAINFEQTTTEGFVTGFSNAFAPERTRQRLGNIAGLYKAPTRQGSLVLAAAFNQTQSFESFLSFEGLNQASITSAFLPFADEFSVETDENGNPFPVFNADLPEIAYLGGAIEFLGENVGTGNELFYEAVNPGSTIEQGSDVIQEGRKSELSFGGAWEAAKGVMVGGSLNFSFGTYDFQSIFEEFDVNGENTPELYEVIDGDLVYRGFTLMGYEESFTSELVGANLRFGISASATNNLRVGLTIETPTTYLIDEQFYTRIYTEFDEGRSTPLDYGGLAGDIGLGNFEYEVQTPWRFGGGLGYSIAGLNLMADVEFVDWTQLEMSSEVDQSFFLETNRSIRENFQAVVNTRLGAEYSFGNVTVRGGIARYPDAIEAPISTGSGAQLDRMREYVSLGAGFRFSNALEINVGWMQEQRDDIYLPDYTDYVVDQLLTRNTFLVGLNVLL